MWEKLDLSGETEDRSLISVFTKLERMPWLKEDTKDVFTWKKSFPLFNFWHAKDQKWEWDHFITAEKRCKVTKNWRRISAAVWYYCSAGKERNKKADLYLRSSSVRCSSDVHLTMVSGDPRLRISEFYRVEFQFCSCGNKLIFFFNQSTENSHSKTVSVAGYQNPDNTLKQNIMFSEDGHS